MTPRSRNAPYRTVPGGATRTPAAANPFFSGILSWNSNGPTSITSIFWSAK